MKDRKTIGIEEEMKHERTIEILDELIPRVEKINDELDAFDKEVEPDREFTTEQQSRLAEIERRYESIAKEGKEKLPAEDAELLDLDLILPFYGVITFTGQRDYRSFKKFKSEVETCLTRMKARREALREYLKRTTGDSDH